MCAHDHDHGFLPAAGHRLFTPLYDVLSRLAGARVVHARAVDLSGIESGHQVLDLGCGTGEVALRVAAQHPGVTVVGLDPDPDMLARARRKSGTVEFVEGFAEDMPFADGRFDRVVSSLALHHIAPAEVARAASEMHRVLRPGGSVLIADLPPTHGGDHGHAHGLLGRLLGRATRVPEVHGVDVAAVLAAAGFADVGPLGQETLRLLGEVTFTRAHRPE